MAPVRSRGQPAKKHRLTLAQLASYDDILTDALIDHAFYWTTIPKNRPSYLPSRGVKEEEISKIIQTHLVVTPDLQVAEAKLLATNGLSKFYRALKTDNEKEDFRRHLRRYMQVYLPDCPFEVSATNRYTIFQEEASITARRFIKSHETIKYLSGIQVVITPEEEAELSEQKKDFSIVVSSRKKEANLFMGPARFANHDCDANARLVTTGQAGIEIIATKPISVGDEITVTYSESYFGEDNCECLCKSCENNLTNGWAPADGSAPVKQSIEDAFLGGAPGYSLRKREESAINRGNSETPSLTPIARPKVRKTRLKNTTRTTEATPATPDLAEAGSLGRSRKRDADSLATPPVTPAKRQKTTSAEQINDIHPLSLPASSRSSSVGNNTGSESSEAETARKANGTVLVIHSPKPTPIAQSIQVLQQEEGQVKEEELSETHNQAPTPESLPQSDSDLCEAGSITVVTSPIEVIEVKGEASPDPSAPALDLPTPESSAASEEDCQLVVITNEVALDPDSSLPTPRANRTASVDVSSNENEDDKDEEDDEADPSMSSRQRVPGDYTLTPLLLSEPETAWVFCTVCSQAFLQHDAYYTRMCCPRCERHSKIYGYMWPKTEPEGKWDKEERVLDHRLIHRFLDAEDEAKIRGRKLVLSKAVDEGGQAKNKAAPTSAKSGMGSGIWRKLKYMTVEDQPKTKASQRVKPAKSGNTTKATSVKAAKAAKATAEKVAPKKAAKTLPYKTTKPLGPAKSGKASEMARAVSRSGRALRASARAARA